MSPKPPRAQTDLAHDILRTERRPLESFFAPKTVAVIGASERVGSVGRTILWNLIASPFGGTVFPVNAQRPSVLGIKAYPTIGDVPENVELAVIVTPSPTVPGVVEECVKAGVQAAIIISAGFKETGPEGVELERRIRETARGKMRIIGPNCLGVMRPPSGLNATFAGATARSGNVGFISQSGALCTAVLDWSLKENVGFSAFVSIGSMLDVGWGDLIDYLGSDPRTSSIVIYMETIGDARAFLSAAREVALTKPIIVIKPGRTEAAAKAAASHTGSLTGSDEVLDAAFRRCGVLRVNTIEDVFFMAEVLAKQPRPHGPRLTVVTNAGGPAVLATDALLLNGAELAEVSEETTQALNAILPTAWSHNNPIDILGDAGADRYTKAIEIAAKDPNTDGMLVVLTPQAMTESTQTAEALKPYAKTFGKPILASWMGGAEVTAGESILSRAGIPTFPYPDAAAKMFAYMWKYTYNLKGIYETPNTTPHTPAVNGGATTCTARQVIDQARKEGRTILTEHESKQVLAAYGIPTVETRVAATAEDAVAAANALGYPVVLKLHSETITHKTDVGGVHLNLDNASAVNGAFDAIRASVVQKAGAKHFLGVSVQPMIRLKDAYELILGSSIDPQFGPVLLFGTGGQLVEVYKDRALALPPLNSTLARRMMEQTKVFKALQGVRGRDPVDLSALEQLLVRFSQLVAEERWIKEIDINPLLVSSTQIVALDGRVVLHDPGMLEEQRPTLAVRPYPLQYVGCMALKDGTPLTIRPIRPEDEPKLVQFHKRLSERSVYMRYFHVIGVDQRTAHERLLRICFNDYDREIALVAESDDVGLGKQAIIAVARLSRLPGTNESEVALLVADQFQRQGIGTELLRRLVEVARVEKHSRMTANILPENGEMQAVFRKQGFTIKPIPDDKIVMAELKL